MPYNVFVRREP
ncbi:hypothetical protein D047_4094A, partial [Vibrio parahaemolyticus VPTS-2010_2]